MNNEQLLKNAMKYSQEFLGFLNQSYSVYHASDFAQKFLEKIGYTKLKENETWNLKKGGKYFFQRNNRAIVAFQIGINFDEKDTGFKIVAAHLDSPCLQIAPISKLQQVGFNQACIQTYGGGLWHTWFDRDLNVGGKIICYNENTKTFQQKLWNSKKPLMKVANLAIHQLTSQEIAAFPVNPETQLRPIISTERLDGIFTKNVSQEKETEQQTMPKCADKHYDRLITLISQDLGIDKNSIYDMELQLSDASQGNFIGMYDEFLSSKRIDNLICSFAALKAIEGTSSNNKKYVDMIVLFDHEEIGSNSTHGAKSTLITDTINRIVGVLTNNGNQELIRKILGNSFIVSTDVTHSVHPNYQDRSQINHLARINKGLNVKHEPAQNSASSCNTRTTIYEIAKRVNVPMFDQVKPQDVSGGSTLGPIISSMTSIRTADVGPSVLGMHSIRETAGILDAYYNFLFDKGFFDEFENLKEPFDNKAKYISSYKNEIAEGFDLIEQL